MTTTKLNWVKVANGSYATTDGRFTIVKAYKRGEYNLTDTHTADPVCPQYRKSCKVYNIEHGKNTAARWVRGVN